MRLTQGQKPGAVLSTVTGRFPSLVDGKENDMTEEEIQAIQNSLDEQTRRVADLEAERDSLREENNQLTSRLAEEAAELAETKKLNFTLARQVDRTPRRGVEEVINDLFK